MADPLKKKLQPLSLFLLIWWANTNLTKSIRNCSDEDGSDRQNVLCEYPAGRLLWPSAALV